MRNKRFEAWFAKRCDLSEECVESMHDGQTYRSRSWNVELAWAAWCEALGFSEASS